MSIKRKNIYIASTLASFLASMFCYAAGLATLALLTFVLALVAWTAFFVSDPL